MQVRVSRGCGGGRLFQLDGPPPPFPPSPEPFGPLARARTSTDYPYVMNERRSAAHLAEAHG